MKLTKFKYYFTTHPNPLRELVLEEYRHIFDNEDNGIGIDSTDTEKEIIERVDYYVKVIHKQEHGEFHKIAIIEDKHRKAPNVDGLAKKGTMLYNGRDKYVG